MPDWTLTGPLKFSPLFEYSKDKNQKNQKYQKNLKNQKKKNHKKSKKSKKSKKNQKNQKIKISRRKLQKDRQMERPNHIHQALCS